MAGRLSAIDGASFTLHRGDCAEQMRQLEAESVDAVVCDPPYGIGFMGHEWDQPGDYGPVSANGEPAPMQSGKRRRSQPSAAAGAGHARDRRPLGYDERSEERDRGGAMHAGRYDLSVEANRRYQAWCEAWAREALRILKPGGYLLASCGTRTYHRLAAGIEDAGFEIRDSLVWLYGSGFPKSVNVHARLLLEGIGAARAWLAAPYGSAAAERRLEAATERVAELEGPVEEAIWEAWGTALKPGHEPIAVARKPFETTVTRNLLDHGVGAINIGGCRIAAGERPLIEQRAGEAPVQHTTYGARAEGSRNAGTTEEGRWPANVLLAHTVECEPVGLRVVPGDPRETGDGRRPGGFADVGAEPGDGEPNAAVYGDELVVEWNCAPGCPVRALDAQSGRLQSGLIRAGSKRDGLGYHGGLGNTVANDSYGDAGGASRFFYCAKTSRAEREAGLSDFEIRIADPYGEHRGRRMEDKSRIDGKPAKRAANFHPTVKPIDLMRWLVRLVTPAGGVVVDPFLGSGSTGAAAVLEGFEFVGIEREGDYLAIAEARIRWWSEHRGREAEQVLAVSRRSESAKRRHVEAGQLDLLG